MNSANLNSITIALASASLAICLSDDVAAQRSPGESEQELVEEKLRKETRDAMAARWNQLQAYVLIDGEQREIERVSDPVFSFSEATRDTGHLGTMWVWGSPGRPAALFVQGKAYRKPIWGFELVALSEGVSVVMHDGWRWSPKTALTMSAFDGAPLPAKSDVGRLLQMKTLARRFVVSEDYFDEKFRLRLLPRPVYRYQDKDAGLIDGALFNFAHGTNPEALLVIECRLQEQGPRWSYGFLPMAGAGVEATLDEITVWSKEPTREARAQELYSTWLETEGQ